MGDTTRELLLRAVARPAARLDFAGFAPAAVLVPVAPGPDGPALLFTLRRGDLSRHAGQISFPGGKRDAADRDCLATALREAEEELGIAPLCVEVLGTLDDAAVPSGYVITPVVGWLAERPELRPRAGEVEEAFWLRLADLADPSCRAVLREREIGGRSFPVPEYRVAGRVIWGATARIVQSLLERLG